MLEAPLLHEVETVVGVTNESKIRQGSSEIPVELDHKLPHENKIKETGIQTHPWFPYTSLKFG